MILKALAFIAPLLLSACAGQPPPAAPEGRIAILIAPETDPALGTATVSVDGQAMGLLDPACGLVVSAAPGERLLRVAWADRSVEARVTLAPGAEIGFVARQAPALEPMTPPEASGFVCPAPETTFRPATPAG